MRIARRRLGKLLNAESGSTMSEERALAKVRVRD
jgi:hypothetical protein